MSLLRQKKEEEVKKLKEKFAKIKAAIFVSYKGLAVKDAEKLRRAIRAEKSEYKVAKKTLLDIAVKEAGLPDAKVRGMGEQIGVAFDYENETGALKAIDQLIKSGISALKIVGGIIEGKIFGASETERLAGLPGKKELRGQAVNVLASPLRGFVGVLNGNIVGLINAIKAVSEKK